MQRMVARVLAAFLFSDSDTVTAAEVGERLGASTGSISGAITMLRTVGLIEPAPVPGSRRAHYRMRDDAWATLMSNQNAMIQVMYEIAAAGVASIPADSPAVRRLERMRDFYSYVFAELPALIDRWQEQQDT
ncbi:MAG: GbsR/MarR family transcriptional regulator [Actinomycetes bacterium]